MVDFIQVDEQTFLNKKIAYDEANPISQKVNGMLDKYDCFQDYSSFQSYTKGRAKQSGHHHHHNNRHHHHHHHHHNRVERKPIFEKSKISSNERETTALLNKLSKRNYTTIIKQIHQSLDKQDLEEFIKNVLDKCHRQPGFLELYVSVLNDVFNKSNGDSKQVIRNLLSEYIQDFIQKREFKDFQLDSKNYMQFCNNVDNKKQIIGKHKTILALIVKILRNNLIDEYFNIMFNEIILIDKAHGKDEYERHELLLDIISDFVKADMKFRSYINKYYKSHTNILDGYSVKARFKVMDIVDN